MLLRPRPNIARPAMTFPSSLELPELLHAEDLTWSPPSNRLRFRTCVGRRRSPMAREAPRRVLRCPGEGLLRHSPIAWIVLSEFHVSENAFATRALAIRARVVRVGRPLSNCHPVPRRTSPPVLLRRLSVADTQRRVQESTLRHRRTDDVPGGEHPRLAPRRDARHALRNARAPGPTLHRRPRLCSDRQRTDVLTRCRRRPSRLPLGRRRIRSRESRGIERGDSPLPAGIVASGRGVSGRPQDAGRIPSQYVVERAARDRPHPASGAQLSALGGSLEALRQRHPCLRSGC